jgi:hypothetical protein
MESPMPDFDAVMAAARREGRNTFDFEGETYGWDSAGRLTLLVRQIETGAVIGSVPVPTEPTAAGLQYIMPGCERREVARGVAPKQPRLF